MGDKKMTISLGTGYFLTDDAAASSQNYLLKVAQEHNIKHIDTARIYSNGQSEEYLGTVKAADHFTISTKIPTGIYPDAGTRDAVFKYVAESLQALKLEKIPVLFLHGPDSSVPISETMGALQELYLRGKFEKFGLSNFTESQVREIYAYNKDKGYVLPTVYQVLYNLVARKQESDLLATLRDLDFSIQAYSPIAAGFLVKSVEDVKSDKGKWDRSTLFGQLLHGLYDKPSYHRYLEEYIKLAKKSGIAQSEIAYRWVVYHSVLRKESDMVIVGAQTAKQLEETMVGIDRGPLEEWVVERLEEMWKIVEGDAPRDNFDAFNELREEGLKVVKEVILT